MASPEPLQPYRQVQANSELELARILSSTANAMEKRIRSLGSGVGATIRKSQLTLTLAAVRKMQRDLWNATNRVTLSGVSDAEKAAESAVEAMTRVAYSALPDAAAEALVRSLRLAAESGLKSDAVRRKRELSERVYRQAALHSGKVEQMIREGIIANLSAKELAASVHDYVDPGTKGGASYAAMRLARTEINNAFHERQLIAAKRPGISGVVWNLSGSHRVPDECNVYAAHGGDGVYPVDQVPDKPHPQCFCYLTYVTMPPEDFQKALAAGDFDDELDRRTKANIERLGGVDRKRTEGKPPATKARPSKEEQAARSTIEPTTRPKSAPVDKPEGKDPLNRVEGKGRDRVQRVLDEQRQFIPNAMRKFNGVRKLAGADLRQFEARFGKSALGGYTVETAEIGIHPQVFTEKYVKEFARDLRTGFYSKCGHDHGSVESFVAHEMGHHVDNMMRRAMPRDVLAVWKAVAEALGIKPPFLTDKTSLDRWVAKNKAAIATKVSRYGSESGAELLAEVWAEYTTNESPRPAIRAIGQAMRTLAERTTV